MFFKKVIEFEFHLLKSNLNRQKHGIDFVDAQKLWDDEKRLEIPAVTRGEKRWSVIGKIKAKFWTAIVTYRGERIRLISARRSRKDERELYESNLGKKDKK